MIAAAARLLLQLVDLLGRLGLGQVVVDLLAGFLRQIASVNDIDTAARMICDDVRRLLGVQVVGGHGAGKRVDAAAAVMWAGGTVDDLAWMDLAYAPPVSTAWEVLQVAARRVAERL